MSLTRGTDEYAWDFDAEDRRVRAEHRVAGSTVDAVRYAAAPTLVKSLESPHAATDDTGAERMGYIFAGEHPLLRYDTATNEPTYYLEDGIRDGTGTGVQTCALPILLREVVHELRDAGKIGRASCRERV